MRFDEETTPLGWGMAIALSLGAAAAISSLFGYPVGGATVGLAAVFVSTFSLVRAMARLVMSMGSEESGLEFVSDDGRSARAWREEKKRSLRAIQELKLDYALQKIGDRDYKSILSQYEARALAAIHALDAKSALHPELTRDLERYQGGREILVPQGADAEKGASTEKDPSEAATAAGDPGERTKTQENAEPANAQTDQVPSSTRPAVRTCSACQTSIMDASARFCKACGKELA